MPIRAKENDDTVFSEWDNPVLVDVITLSEASLMWGMYPGGIKQAIFTGKLSARRAITGGTWLISYVSMVKVYGNPRKDLLSCRQQSR